MPPSISPPSRSGHKTGPGHPSEPILEEDDSEDGDMIGEEEALRILTAQKEALKGPISPFDAAHSDDEEQKHLACAKVLLARSSSDVPFLPEFPSLTQSRPGPGSSSREVMNRREGSVWQLGKIPRYTQATEPGSPPPAKKHQDGHHTPTVTFVLHTPPHHRQSPDATAPPEDDPRNTESDDEGKEVANPWGTIDGRAPSIYTTPAIAYRRFPWVSGLNAKSFISKITLSLETLETPPKS
ncbi:hypothetical protein EV361DRAFT_956692 [Lentinula raphanica]|nr:hypothetical protein EV361DRAFT_956692 [Lentinula raphanica]